MYKKGLGALAEPYRTLVQRLLEELKGVLDGKLVSLIVYGSVARGDAGKESDLDLLVVAEELPRSRLARISMFDRAEERLQDLLGGLLEEGYAVALSPIIKTRREAMRVSPLYLDMVEDAVIVYDKDGFFEKILARLKKRLEELGAERVRVGRKWYWRLKKDFRFGEAIVIE